MKWIKWDRKKENNAHEHNRQITTHSFDFTLYRAYRIQITSMVIYKTHFIEKILFLWYLEKHQQNQCVHIFRLSHTFAVYIYIHTIRKRAIRNNSTQIKIKATPSSKGERHIYICSSLHWALNTEHVHRNNQPIKTSYNKNNTLVGTYERIHVRHTQIRIVQRKVVASIHSFISSPFPRIHSVYLQSRFQSRFVINVFFIFTHNSYSRLVRDYLYFKIKLIPFKFEREFRNKKGDAHQSLIRVDRKVFNLALIKLMSSYSHNHKLLSLKLNLAVFEGAALNILNFKSQNPAQFNHFLRLWQPSRNLFFWTEKL